MEREREKRGGDERKAAREGIRLVGGMGGRREGDRGSRREKRGEGGAHGGERKYAVGM